MAAKDAAPVEQADEQAKDAAPVEQADEQASEPSDVTVIVRIEISGNRDGKPWPPVGGQITLPADEAADYLRFGYVRPVE